VKKFTPFLLIGFKIISCSFKPSIEISNKFDIEKSQILWDFSMIFFDQKIKNIKTNKLLILFIKINLTNEKR